MGSQTRNIRLFAFACLLSLSVLRVECSNNTQRIDCETLTNTTKADWDEFSSTYPNTQPKKNIKCYFKCSMEKHGHLKDGKLQLDAIVKAMLTIAHYNGRLADLQKDVNKCKDKTGKDDCDTAFGIVACLHDSDIYL